MGEPPFAAPSEPPPGAPFDAPPPPTEPRRVVEEWPPREWRETTRSAGHRQALYVALSMVAMFAVLVAVNIWGAKQG